MKKEKLLKVAMVGLLVLFPCVFVGLLLLPTVGWAGPLHAAARDGEVERVKKLLSKGGDVNERDGGGSTPLHQAVLHSRVEVVELLVEKGAEINTQDNTGATPLYAAVDPIANVPVVYNHSLPRGEPQPNTKLLVLETILAHGGDLNISTNQKYTPLHKAVVRGLQPKDGSWARKSCASN